MSRTIEEKGKGTCPPRGASAAGRKTRRHEPITRHPLEVRRKAVRLHLEEGIPLDLVGQELGVTRETLRKWVER